MLLYPSHPTLAPYHNEPLFRPLNFTYTAIFNALGFPVTQVPLGLAPNGLPLGIQVSFPVPHYYTTNIMHFRTCFLVMSKWHVIQWLFSLSVNSLYYFMANSENVYGFSLEKHGVINFMMVNEAVNLIFTKFPI